MALALTFGGCFDFGDDCEEAAAAGGAPPPCEKF